MGKKNAWFYAVKKAISCEAKENKDQRAYKSKKKWFRKKTLIPSPPPLPPRPSFNVEDVKIIEVEVIKNTNDYIVAPDTAVKLVCFDKCREEEAIIKIQTTFRKYLSRKAMRGLMRLKSLIQSKFVECQAASALNHMHTLAYVESRNRCTRIRMLEQNQAFQRQLQQRYENEANIQHKHEKQVGKSKAFVGESWNLSRQSKEEIEARQLNKQSAALRREKALAYASSHQKSLKKSSKSKNQTDNDPNNLEYLSWSWRKQWMADRPWDDIQTSIAKTNPDTRNHFSLEDIDSDHNLNQFNMKTRPPFRHSTVVASNISKPPTSKRVDLDGGNNGRKSLVRAQSELIGKYKNGEWSSMNDDDNVTTSPISSLVANSKVNSMCASLMDSHNRRHEITKKGSTKSTKKLLSFPTSLTLARHSSGPH